MYFSHLQTVLIFSNFFTYTECEHSAQYTLLCPDMATENKHAANIFSSCVPKVKPGIKLISVTVQQHISNNLPDSLCTAPEGDPSDDEEMSGANHDQEEQVKS